MKKKQLGLMFAVTMLMVAQVVANEVPAIDQNTVTGLTEVVGGAVNTLVEGVKNSPLAQSALLRETALVVKAHGKDAAQAAQSLVSKGFNALKVVEAWRSGLFHASEAWNMKFAHEQSTKLMKAAQLVTRLSAATLALFINKKIVEAGLSSSETTKKQIAKFISLIAYYYYLSPALKKAVHVLWNKLLKKYASAQIQNALSLKRYKNAEMPLVLYAGSEDDAVDAINDYTTLMQVKIIPKMK